MSNAPAKRIRLGYVTATIWKNDGTNAAFYTVELQRSYKDDDGTIKNTSSMNHADLPGAVWCLQKATDWIANQ